MRSWPRCCPTPKQPEPGSTPDGGFNCSRSQTRHTNGLVTICRRRVIAMRKNFKAFSRGSMEFLLPENSKVLAFLRRYENETILVVVNLSRFAQSTQLDLSRFSGCTLMEVFSQNYFPRIRKSAYPIMVGPHAFYWFALRPQPSTARAPQKRRVPTLGAPAQLEALFTGDVRSRLEREILPGYIQNCRWFGSKAPRSDGSTIVPPSRTNRSANPIAIPCPKLVWSLMTKARRFPRLL